MRLKLAGFAFLFLVALPVSELHADVATTSPAPPKKKVAVEVHATLSFTECVAKLLNNGLGAQEARQLCIDTVSN